MTLAMTAGDDPSLAAHVRTIGSTERVAGLPFVTSRRTPDAPVALLRSVLAIEHEATRLAYPELA